jgi:metallophosphoesterase (TIGR00282 family)
VLKILFIADVIGSPGRDVIQAVLPDLKRRTGANLTIVNAENSAGGFGVTRDSAADLFKAGADVITGGNHLWDRREGAAYIVDEPRLVRPANMPPGTPGQGWAVFKASDGTPVGVVNLLGRVFMKEVDDPFRAADQAVEALRGKCRAVLVDFHAETSAEKMALGWHLDGRVSAVIGTHTHVQTADERVLPRGTAFLGDAGMTGGFDSVIGMDREAALRRFLTLRPERLTPAPGDLRVNGALIEVDPATGNAVSITRIQIAHGERGATAAAAAGSATAGGPTRLLRGEEPALAIRLQARAEVERLRQGGIQPTLALVSVGEDEASKIYLARKARACSEVGIEVRRIALAGGSELRAVVDRVRQLGADPEVHGILVQLPLDLRRSAGTGPAAAQQVIEAIPPLKDVDGFHPDNVGRLSLGLPCLMPCTPRGIVELLRHHGVALAGAHAVVLGRSPIVGRPLATLLSQKGMDCTVTLGHSASGPALQNLAREADILIAAMGRAEAVTAAWVKPGATVVDVGIHRIADPSQRTGSRLTGDVHAASVMGVAGALTPVPGGVGPMTVAMVVANTALAAGRQAAGARV